MHVDRAGRERGLIAGKVHGERRDLLGFAQPQHRLARDERLPAASRSPDAAMRPASEGESTVPGQIALQRMPLVT